MRRHMNVGAWSRLSARLLFGKTSGVCLPCCRFVTVGGLRIALYRGKHVVATISMKSSEKYTGSFFAAFSVI